jgi:ketosteroid isomerase-like protein
MSQENVEVVQSAFAEFERGNFWLPEVFDPSVRITWLVALGPIPAQSVGLEQLGSALKAWLESWERVTLTAERFIDAGDQVVVIAAWHARGKTSGVATEWRHGEVWTMRGGRATAVTTYRDPAEALEAARPSE